MTNGSSGERAQVLDVAFTVQKVQATLAQISELTLADFAYDEPRSALGLLRSIFEQDVARLRGLDPGTDPAVRKQVCAQANARIALYHDNVLGFLLRATNVRNAFEVYDPLLQLSKKVCGSDAKLILSSEWSFSPLTYPAVFPDLPDLIFIGLPATEAGNALML
jgi:hypothetical protein